MGKHAGTGVGAKKTNRGSGGGAAKVHAHGFATHKKINLHSHIHQSHLSHKKSGHHGQSKSYRKVATQAPERLIHLQQKSSEVRDRRILFRLGK